MKIKYLALGVAIAAIIFYATASAAYIPRRPATRAQVSEAMTDYYIDVNSADEEKIVPVAPPSYAPLKTRARVPVTIPADTLQDLVVRKISAEEGKFGKNSVYIGSDSMGNYIKNTATTAANNFLRIMFGTTKRNAVEKIRILSNGFIGIGTTNPQAPLHVSGTLKATSLIVDNITTAAINPHGAGLSIRTNDMSVSNEFCLQDGTKTPIANPYHSVTDAQWLSLKCFKYACPTANGQWTLSQTTCAATLHSCSESSSRTRFASASRVWFSTTYSRSASPKRSAGCSTRTMSSRKTCAFTAQPAAWRAPSRNCWRGG